MACYEIRSCQDSNVIETIDTTAVLAAGDFIKPTPAITGPGYLLNCWEVLGSSAPPCVPGAFSVTSVVIYNTCPACLTAPTPCYSLTSCDGLTVLYTNANLLPFIGGYVTNAIYPGQCFYVAVSQNCVGTVPFDNPQPCSCPCYSLRDCTGVIPPFNTTSNLATHVGNLVHLNQHGGCAGPCFFVSVNTGTCLVPQPVTVSTGCQTCPPCVCYRLIDCITRVPYLTINGPTLNGVDLAPLVGQVIGQVCLGPNNTQCTTGCWEIQTVQCNGNQSSVYVYNIFPTCQACNAVCYKLTNCETFQEVLVEYTIPNATLPNISTLVGQTLNNPCFTGPTGCLSGCWTVSLNNGPNCNGSVNWTTALSYTAFPTCNDCLPKCYLLTECAPSVAPPIVVNNDLSIYVGSTVKICDSNDVCKCYDVELAQTCSGADTLDNANARFIDCDECNSCFCPPGYIKVDNRCQKITSVPAVRSEKTYTATAGSVSNTYGSSGTRFYPGASSLPYPLTAVTGPDRFVDASSTNVFFTSSAIGVWGGPTGSRLNTVGVWTTNAPAPLNEWIGFAKCIVNTQATIYSIGIGGDDHIRIKLDGVIVAEATIGSFDYNFWHVFELNIQAGTHVIVVEGRNTGGTAAFGAEIYQASVATVSAIAAAPALQAVTIFSTFPKRTDSSLFDTGQNSGYSCPTGYTYNNCGVPSCSLIETIPYTDCPDTFRVTDCAGIQDPVITNTDLSAFLTGSYKACFTVPGPWPNGCYCITVEQIDYEVGVSFPALISPTAFDCCEDCLLICYVLTDCQNAIGPFTVCNDLADYVGKVIKITGCGDTCWQVSVAQSCTGNTIFGGDVIEFEDCEACLPPPPPPPVPYDLDLRKIKPGYNSPNSCYTTNYIEKINCSFAEQVYNAMLVKRYGITMCCEEDLMMWDIRKQLMDLDILKDPKMCKSTLCDCPAPCLIDAVFALLPFCATPNIVSVVTELPCPNPELVDVEITYSPAIADCNCYTITPLEQPIQMVYIDCCCDIHTVVIDNLTPINVCATTPPAIYPQSSSATIVLNGDCDAAGPCNPPTCYCWKVTNPIIGSPDGTALFDSCTSTGLYVSAFVPAGQSISSCGYYAPTVSRDLIIENLGPCVNGACVPPVCTCYEIISPTPCEYSYTNCSGVNVNTVVPANTPTYVCAQTVPIRFQGCPPGGTITATPYNCVNGVCTPPTPCICYLVVVSSTDGTGCIVSYTPCGGAPVLQNYPDGDHYICSQVPPTQGGGAFCSVVVASTPFPCINGICQRP